jgi:hypothetical protein
VEEAVDRLILMRQAVAAVLEVFKKTLLEALP